MSALKGATDSSEHSNLIAAQVSGLNLGGDCGRKMCIGARLTRANIMIYDTIRYEKSFVSAPLQISIARVPRSLRTKMYQTENI